MSKKHEYEYFCPCCHFSLNQSAGQNGGLYLYCSNVNCPSQEIYGFGKDEDEAYQVILDKYGSHIKDFKEKPPEKKKVIDSKFVSYE